MINNKLKVLFFIDGTEKRKALLIQHEKEEP